MCRDIGTCIGYRNALGVVCAEECVGMHIDIILKIIILCAEECVGMHIDIILKIIIVCAEECVGMHIDICADMCLCALGTR